MEKKSITCIKDLAWQKQVDSMNSQERSYFTKASSEFPFFKGKLRLNFILMPRNIHWNRSASTPCRGNLRDKLKTQIKWLWRPLAINLICSSGYKFKLLDVIWEKVNRDVSSKIVKLFSEWVFRMCKTHKMLVLGFPSLQTARIMAAHNVDVFTIYTTEILESWKAITRFKWHFWDSQEFSPIHIVKMTKITLFYCKTQPFWLLYQMAAFYTVNLSPARCRRNIFFMNRQNTSCISRFH